MVRSLGDLTQGAIKAEQGFSGFSRALGEMANASSKASKRWTIFSRLVSGTPIWALQNKIRAYVDILAQIDQKTKDVNGSQLESINQTVEQMKTLRNVKQEYSDLRGAFIAYEQQSVAFSDTHKKLLENTNAFHLALASGDNEFTAYKKALAEIGSEYEKLEKNVNKASEALTYQANLETFAGKRQIRKDIAAKRDEIRARGSGIQIGGTFADARQQGLSRPAAGVVTGFTVAAKPLVATVKFIGEDIEKFTEAWKNRTKLSEKWEKFSLNFQTKMLKLADFVRPVFSLLFKYLVMAMFVSIGILAFIAAFNEIKENFDLLSVSEQIASITQTLYEVFGGVINLLTAIFGGRDIETVMKYLNDLLSSTLNLLLQVGLLALTVGFATLIGLIEGLGKILFTKEYREVGLSILSKFGKAFLILYFVRYLAIKMMEIAAIYALPILFAVALAGVIVTVLKKAFQHYEKIPRRATGGIVNENMTLVGERGPELVSLPRGSRVHTNNQTKNMGGKVTNNFNITINAKDTSDAELRRIAEKIGNMVNNKINRSFSSTTMR